MVNKFLDFLLFCFYHGAISTYFKTDILTAERTSNVQNNQPNL